MELGPPVKIAALIGQNPNLYKIILLMIFLSKSFLEVKSASISSDNNIYIISEYLIQWKKSLKMHLQISWSYQAIKDCKYYLIY